jgi:hypothetical protein
MYRIFIDEVGTHDMKSCQTATEQYLGVTGVIMNLDYERGAFTTELNQLKLSCFGDAGIVLDRREILDCKPPLEVLKNALLRQQFDEALMQMLINAQYQVFTAGMDKKEHVNRYTV